MSKEEAARRLLSGRAWDDFLDVLRIAGHTIDRWGDEIGDLERAEWYRFMTRVVRNGCERFIENCEPYRPRLRDAPWKSTINFQSPDQDHFLCEFDEPGEYRITGGRGTIPYFVIAAWSAAQPKDIGERDWAPRGFEGLKEFDPATLKTGAFVQSDTLEFKPDGTFELIVSQHPHPGNWLKIEADTVGLLIRTVYHRRSEERAPEFRIERLDKALPRPVEPADVAANLAKAAQEALGYAELVRSWWQDNLSKRPNRLRFSRATYLSNGGVPDRHFAFGTWSIREGEALTLQFKPPECEYWIFQLCNVWQENLDNYEDGQGYVTKFTAHYEADGSVRIVVAARDPGIGGNWVNPFGHRLGGMGLRLIKTDRPPPVTAHLVPLDELAAMGWICLDAADAIESGEVVP